MARIKGKSTIQKAIASSPMPKIAPAKENKTNIFTYYFTKPIIAIYKKITYNNLPKSNYKTLSQLSFWETVFLSITANGKPFAVVLGSKIQTFLIFLIEVQFIVIET